MIAALSLAVGIGFTQVSALFASFPALVQSVFAQNCVAVVFLVAVVANLVLPKDAGTNDAVAAEVETGTSDKPVGTEAPASRRTETSRLRSPRGGRAEATRDVSRRSSACRMR